MYDVVSTNDYLERTKLLWTFAALEHLHKVKTLEVNNADELKSIFHRFLAEGYEGAMYRNPHMPYEDKRSAGLLKVKIMQDAEFKIIGVSEGKGKLEGHAGAFVCQIEDKAFRAKLKGNTEDLIEYFENFEKYKGKLLTVQYQGLTPDKIPRFPVGLRIRDAE